MLLRLESARSTTECKFCHTVTEVKSKSFANLIHYFLAGLLSEEFTTKRSIAGPKDWMKDATKAGEKSKQATIEQDCEQEGCGNNLMYFYSRQTRSVDEGQTVYYECTKCGHTEAQNT